MPVSSVPLSETHMVGRPRTAMRSSSLRATRRLGSNVSGSARHCRVKASTIARMRKQCDTRWKSGADTKPVAMRI